MRIARETKRRALPNWLRHCVTRPQAEACGERGHTDGSARQSRLSHASPTIDFLALPRYILRLPPWN